MFVVCRDYELRGIGGNRRVGCVNNAAILCDHVIIYTHPALPLIPHSHRQQQQQQQQHAAVTDTEDEGVA